MTSFDDVRRAQRETATIIAVLLTFMFVLVSSRVLPNVVNNGIYLLPLFYAGVVVFGLIGFLALEILGAISFLGGGVRVVVGVFIALLLAGSWIGGDYMVTFLSGSIVGMFLFYVKSAYIMYKVLSIETQEDEHNLSFTELDPQGSLKHFKIEGIGSNFELLSSIIGELKGDSDVMFFARYNPPKYRRRDALMDETMKFYANNMMSLHKVKSKKSSIAIKQICLECTTPEAIEKDLINYWLRAHLTGGYTCIMVPYEDNFLAKASACESSIEEAIKMEEIIGRSPWLLKTESLTGNHDNYQDFYTIWDKEILSKKITLE